MSPDHRMLEASRRATRTLFVVAGLYVAIGLAVAASAALAGDRLSAFLGFLIITGALGAGVMMHAVLRLTARTVGLGDRLDQVHERLFQMERRLERADFSTLRTATESRTQTIDLSTIGGGDPSGLVAATLERSRFPRLVTVIETPVPMDEEHSTVNGGVSSTTSAGSRAAVGNGSSEPPAGESEPAFDEIEVLRFQATAHVLTRNLLREWRVGMRDGDLAACRRVFSALVDTADTSTVLPLSVQLQELTRRTETRLRGEFAAAVKARDYARALQIGEQIKAWMPGEAMAEEFEEIRPHLERRVGSDVRAGLPG